MLVIEKLKGYALMVLAVLLVLLGAYAMGGRASKKSAEKKEKYRDALREAAGAKGVHDAEIETRKLPTGGAADQLRADWMRDADDSAPKGGT